MNKDRMLNWVLFDMKPPYLVSLTHVHMWAHGYDQGELCVCVSLWLKPHEAIDIALNYFESSR